MDQDFVHMVTASKVPIRQILPEQTKQILKPGEYELWRMRMEQYIQMIDYSLLRVIENGNAPPLTKVVKGVETIIAPTTAEEKTQRRSNGAVNTAHDATTASTQATVVNSTTIDNLSDAVICAFFASGMAMLSMRARRFMKNTRRKFSVNVIKQKKSITLLHGYSSTSSNSEVSNDSNCSSSCLENVKILKEQNEQLLKDLRTSKLNAIAYKIGLESVEARLLVYKKNEYVYEEDIKVLKRKIHLREVAIIDLKRKLELAQKQKDEIQLISLGYNAVPPPYTGNFMPPKPDLSFSGLEEFTSEPIVIKPVVENSEAKASEAKPKAVRKNNGAPIIEDWVSDNEEDDVPQAKIEKKTFKPSFAKIEFVKPKQQEKTARKTVNHVKQNRKNIHIPRGNQRNWNNMMSWRLGSNFEMFNKACYVCGSFDHLQNFAKKTHPCPKKNMVPRAVLMKSGLVSLNTARQVNTARPKEVVNAARPKAVVNAVKGNNVNAVKASACWVWKPKTKVLDHGNPQMDLQDQGVIDSGCSRHMTGNMSYLTDYEEIDG
ncbi:hypothetical protein Tco_0830366, partial [Tanacetum coccineum]